MTPADPRPRHCRFRLEEEGKPYPRSSCDACGRSVLAGLGKSCAMLPDAAAGEPAPPPRTDPNALLERAARALADAKRLWPARHPAAGMIIGIEQDCAESYERVCAALKDVCDYLAEVNTGP